MSECMSGMQAVSESAKQGQHEYSYAAVFFVCDHVRRQLEAYKPCTRLTFLGCLTGPQQQTAPVIEGSQALHQVRHTQKR